MAGSSTRESPRKTAYINTHLIDPASGLNETGALLSEGENIADVGPDLFRNGTGWTVPDGIDVVDCKGQYLSPGFVDVRVEVGEPGQEHRGTLATAGRAATGGGITTMVCLPNTEPVIDDMSVVEFVARRARKLGLTKVYPYGALTKGHQWQGTGRNRHVARSRCRGLHRWHPCHCQCPGYGPGYELCSHLRLDDRSAPGRAATNRRR